MQADLIVPIESHTAPIPLHACDQLLGPVYIRLAYYYERAPEKETLRASLVALLARYPVFAGRMRADAEGRWEVHFPRAAGARFEFVQRQGRGPEKGPEVLREAQAFLPSNPLWLTSDSTSLLIARLTRFSDGSGVLGIALSHALVDGEGCSQLVDDWARLARGERLERVISHDRRALERIADGLIDVPVEASRFLRLSTPRFAATQTGLIFGILRSKSELLYLSADALTALHECAQVQAHGFVSPLDTLTAGLARTVAPARSRDALPFSVIVDMRKRLRSLLPEGLCANFSSSATASLDASELRNAPIGRLATQVRGAIESVDTDSLARDLAFLRGHRAKQRGRLWPTAIDILRRSGVLFDSWTKQAMFDADFGSGRPHWVEIPAFLPDGIMLFMPTAERDGSVMVRANVSGATRSLLRDTLPGVNARERGKRLIDQLLARG